VPFRIMRVKPSLSSPLTLATVGEATRLHLSVWKPKLPAPRSPYSVAAVASQLEALRAFATESWGTTELLSKLGIAPPLGLLVSGAAGIGKTGLLEHYLEASGIRQLEVSSVEVLTDSGAARQYLECVDLSQVIRQCLVDTERTGERCVVVFRDLDSFARLSSELTEAGIGKMAQALAQITSVSRVRYIGIAQEAVPASLRRLFHREMAISLPERKQRAEILAAHLDSLQLAASKSSKNPGDHQTLVSTFSDRLAAVSVFFFFFLFFLLLSFTFFSMACLI